MHIAAFIIALYIGKEKQNCKYFLIHQYKNVFRVSEDLFH